LAIGFYHSNNRNELSVYTPAGIKHRGNDTPPPLWMFAKMHALCADFNAHESIRHLAMGHLYCEPFAIAHNNVYAQKTLTYDTNGSKPIPDNYRKMEILGKLLKPHFVDLLPVNEAARMTLVSNDAASNTLNPFLALPGTSFLACISDWYTAEAVKGNPTTVNGSFNLIGFEDELNHRGFENVNIPQYHF
jgi:Lipoxygenase